MKDRRVGILMNGVTGRMGTNQHLIRSILAIRKQGGVRADDEVICPEPLLIGRNESKLKRLAPDLGISKYSTDLDACLSRGVQLAEKSIESWAKRCWMDVEPLEGEV